MISYTELDEEWGQVTAIPYCSAGCATGRQAFCAGPPAKNEITKFYRRVGALLAFSSSELSRRFEKMLHIQSPQTQPKNANNARERINHSASPGSPLCRMAEEVQSCHKDKHPPAKLSNTLLPDHACSSPLDHLFGPRSNNALITIHQTTNAPHHQIASLIPISLHMRPSPVRTASRPLLISRRSATLKKLHPFQPH